MRRRLFYNSIVFRLIAPPLFGFVLYLLILMFFDSIEMLTDNFFSREVLFIVALTYLFFELNRLIIVIFNLVFQNPRQLQLRIISQYFISVIISIAVISWILHLYFVNIEGFSTIRTELITFNSLFLFVAVFYHLFFFSLIYLNRKNESKVEKEKMMRENLDIEFQTFKNQINPELLFQSLEIIISELHRDKKSADDLINKLSKTYRYTLDNKHNDLVSLKKEIESLSPLSGIFQAKYPGSFTVEFDCDKKYPGKNLIPGSLQILLENALSENIISETMPLAVSIKTENNNVLFEYELNEKISGNKEVDLRLKYLQKAYSYFSDEGITHTNIGGKKSIRLPLLEIEEE